MSDYDIVNGLTRPPASEPDKTIASVVLAGWKIVERPDYSPQHRYLVVGPDGTSYGTRGSRYSAALLAESYIWEGDKIAAMSRASDIKARRKLRHGQAVMLGITIEKAGRRGARWHFVLPEHLRSTERGYVSGYFERRWACVDSALRNVGVIEWEEAYRGGNRSET